MLYNNSMFKNFKIFPFELSLWFSWIVVTIIYLFSLDSGITAPSWSFGTFVGMFTPLGFWSSFMGIFGGISRFINPGENVALSIVSRIVLISIMFFTLSYGEKLAQHFGFDGSKPMSKLLFNLTVLLCLTFIVDMFIYGHWLSLYLLIGLKIPGGSL